MPARFGHALLNQRRTPDYQNPDMVKLPFRHIAARKALLAVIVVIVVLALTLTLTLTLTLPLLLLTSWLSNSPAQLSKDPAVQAIQTYERSLDGEPVRSSCAGQGPLDAADSQSR
jgi:hypothetical protein